MGHHARVNGPTSWIKLSNGQKIIYLFGEYHVNFNECKYPFDNFDVYLKNQFDSTNKPIDFFLETFYQGNLHVGNTSYSPENQIRRLRKYFSHVSESGVYTHKQHRMHYFDFREELGVAKCYQCYKNIFIFNHNNCTNNLYWLKELEQAVREYFKQLENPDNSRFLKKLLTKHTNEKLKKQVHELVTFMSDRCKQFLDRLTTFIHKYDRFVENINNGKLDKEHMTYWKTNLTLTVEFRQQHLDKQWDYIDAMWTFIGCSIIDMYVIRRLLDKAYINDCILYAGFYHINHIIYLLVKNFNFHVVDQDAHIDPSKLEANIGKMSYDDFILNGGITDMFPELFTQCVMCPNQLF